MKVKRELVSNPVFSPSAQRADAGSRRARQPPQWLSQRICLHSALIQAAGGAAIVTLHAKFQLVLLAVVSVKTRGWFSPQRWLPRGHASHQLAANVGV